jgi:hypothetical protein
MFSMTFISNALLPAAAGNPGPLGILSGMGTDPNTGPLLVLLALLVIGSSGPAAARPGTASLKETVSNAPSLGRARMTAGAGAHGPFDRAATALNAKGSP